MTLRLAQDVRFRRILDEGVLLRLATGEILGLNDVGARVMELVSDAPRSRRDVVEALRDEMTTRPDADVEGDVDSFLEELLELGAVLEASP